MSESGKVLSPHEVALWMAKERGYIRIRLYEDQAVDLVQILFHEKNRLVEQKLKEREETGVVSAETRRLLKNVSRLWQVIAESMDEVGWDRP